MAGRVFCTIACAVLGGCILAGAACLIIMWPWKGPYLPPIGQELSTVEGVSIVRIGPTGSRNSRSGSSKRKAYINAEGIDLLTFLGMASGNHDPIIVLNELPKGQYRVSAQAGSGWKRSTGEDSLPCAVGVIQLPRHPSGG